MRSNGRTFADNARRKQITLAAIEVIAEIGYAQASIRKIAERVGVAMSVVLYHFANKDDLVREIVHHSFREALDAIVPALEMERTAGGKLRAYIVANADFMLSHRTQYSAVFDIGMSYRTAGGDRMNAIALDPELVADIAKLDLATILREGQESGEFRDFDVAHMASAINGAVRNGPLLELALNPNYDMDGYAGELVTTFDLATRRG
ncbi:TetR/AcrR family transcriptional regulator [Kutzneria chonburiensis]|uniref:TetR/AcrR family transcriptional regulator n=1 Tax=Kutzneria chonburiensis TaxID=1483604 RepID=A0ABV6MT33_9PSEU|nr:TetR/AcrR family transcriptional regulator [Kutzneria chonburiensis]